MPIKFAISGKIGTGKTTLADFLPYKRIAFGDILKKECSETYGIPLYWFYTRKHLLLNVHGQYMTIRKLLQWHGTEYRRAQNPHYWTERFDQLLPKEPVIVDDVRFIDEAEYCKSKGAVLIRLQPYPGYNQYSDHKSETELDDYDFDLVFKPDYGKIKAISKILCSDNHGLTKLVKYRCPECGWVGTENDMSADYLTFDDGGEIWSNNICPNCEAWHDIDDYEQLE